MHSLRHSFASRLRNRGRQNTLMTHRRATPRISLCRRRSAMLRHLYGGIMPAWKIFMRHSLLTAWRALYHPAAVKPPLTVTTFRYARTLRTYSDALPPCLASTSPHHDATHHLPDTLTLFCNAYHTRRADAAATSFATRIADIDNRDGDERACCGIYRLLPRTPPPPPRMPTSCHSTPRILSAPRRTRCGASSAPAAFLPPQRHHYPAPPLPFLLPPSHHQATGTF